MKRLGAPMHSCPACSDTFQTRRLPRFWVHTYINSTLIYEEDAQDLFCSQPCAESFAEDLKRKHPSDQKHNDHYAYVAFRQDSEDGSGVAVDSNLDRKKTRLALETFEASFANQPSTTCPECHNAFRTKAPRHWVYHYVDHRLDTVESLCCSASCAKSHSQQQRQDVKDRARQQFCRSNDPPHHSFGPYEEVEV